ETTDFPIKFPRERAWYRVFRATGVARCGQSPKTSHGPCVLRFAGAGAVLSWPHKRFAEAPVRGATTAAGHAASWRRMESVRRDQGLGTSDRSRSVNWATMPR